MAHTHRIHTRHKQDTLKRPSNYPVERIHTMTNWPLFGVLIGSAVLLSILAVVSVLAYASSGLDNKNLLLERLSFSFLVFSLLGATACVVAAAMVVVL